MDAETEQRIEKTVRGILEESNMDEMTEFKIRKQASEVLDLDLSKPPYKALVKRVVQSFLEEQNQKEQPQQQQQVEADENPKIGDAQDQEYDDNGDLFICRLSSKRKVTLQEFRGKSLVSTREFYSKDGKELPTAKGSVKFDELSREAEEEVHFVKSKLSEEERSYKSLLTHHKPLHSGLLQGMAGVVKGTTSVVLPTKVAKSFEGEKMRTLMERRAKGKAAKTRQAKVAKVATPSEGVGAEEGGGIGKGNVASKRVRFDQDGRATAVAGEPKVMEEAHRNMMGVEPNLPPFELGDPPHPPDDLDDLFHTEVESIDFDAIKRQKKEVHLTMHRQEVPLVKAMLHGVKMKYEDVMQTKGTDFSSRTKKAFLISANALGQVYVTLDSAEKEVDLAMRQKKEAKAAVAKAKIALQERSALQLRNDELDRELKEAKKQLNEVRAELERSREELKQAKDVLSAVMERVNELERSGEERAVKAVEDYKVSEEFRSLVLDGIVEELYSWEKRVARFNPDLEINFDIGGTPPSLLPGKEWLDGSPSGHDRGEGGDVDA